MTAEQKSNPSLPGEEVLPTVWDMLMNAEISFVSPITDGEREELLRQTNNPYLDDSAIYAVRHQYARLLRKSVEARRSPLSVQRDGERLVLDNLRVAMRAIGPHYHLVEGAAERARKSGQEERAERLEHVYGRLYYMDYALGTLDERASRPSREAKPEPEFPLCERCGGIWHDDVADCEKPTSSVQESVPTTLEKNDAN